MEPIKNLLKDINYVTGVEILVILAIVVYLLYVFYALGIIRPAKSK